jgi:YHS domain-containing protein
LTPLFWVDYTRFIARETRAHLSVDQSGGNGRPGSWAQKKHASGEHARQAGPHRASGKRCRVSLEERIDRWIGQGMAWLVRKLVTMLLRNSIPAPTSRRAPTGVDVTRPAIALHRDPWCGTHVSSEISFPLEQAGQVMHFCSAECRTRYQQSLQRAASA